MTRDSSMETQQLLALDPGLLILRVRQETNGDGSHFAKKNVNYVVAAASSRYYGIDFRALTELT